MIINTIISWVFSVQIRKLGLPLVMATSGDQSEGHMDTSESQGHLPISDVDMASSDEEPEGQLVMAGSAEHEEDLDLVRLGTGGCHCCPL